MPMIDQLRMQRGGSFCLWLNWACSSFMKLGLLVHIIRLYILMVEGATSVALEPCSRSKGRCGSYLLLWRKYGCRQGGEEGSERERLDKRPRA